MVLVDSSVWIESLRRKGSLEVKLGLEGLLEVYEAQWCTPVRLEVLGGARLAERHALGTQFSVIPYRRCTEADWERALTLAWKLRDAGFSLPWLDVLIASIAIHDGNRLYTVDAHFQHVCKVSDLHLYTPSYGGMFNPDS